MPAFTAHASASIYFIRRGKNGLVELLAIQWATKGNALTATDGDGNIGVQAWNVHGGHDGAMWTLYSRYVVARYDISKAADLPTGGYPVYWNLWCLLTHR